MELVRIAGRYRLQGKVASGFSHEVYFARNILSEENLVIKLEPVEGKDHTLDHEVHVYMKLSGGAGIPRVRWFGMEAGFNAMAVDRLGPSLEDLFVRCHFRFTMRTVLLLAGQLLHCLQYIHSRNFIHRDLKPSNIVMGIGKQANIVYLINFGLSKEFRDPNTHVHIPYNNGLGLIGTTNFASINSHLGLELGRRDDMESLAYILIYFLCGSLPWQGMEVEGHDIVKLKRGIITHNSFQGLPMEFCAFLEHCRSLSFDAKPDYDHFRDIFNNLLLQEGFQSNLTFDWDAVGGPLPRRSSRRDFRGGCGILNHSPKRRTGLRSQTSISPSLNAKTGKSF